MSVELIKQIEDKTNEFGKVLKDKTVLEKRESELALEHLQKKRNFVLNPHEYIQSEIGKTESQREAQRRLWMDDHYKNDYENKGKLSNVHNHLTFVQAELKLLYAKLEFVENNTKSKSRKKADPPIDITKPQIEEKPVFEKEKTSICPICEKSRYTVKFREASNQQMCDECAGQGYTDARVNKTQEVEPVSPVHKEFLESRTPVEEIENESAKFAREKANEQANKTTSKPVFKPEQKATIDDCLAQSDADDKLLKENQAKIVITEQTNIEIVEIPLIPEPEKFIVQLETINEKNSNQYMPPVAVHSIVTGFDEKLSQLGYDEKGKIAFMNFYQIEYNEALKITQICRIARINPETLEKMAEVHHAPFGTYEIIFE